MTKKLNNRLILIFLPVLGALFYMGRSAGTSPASPVKECCQKEQKQCGEKPGANNLPGGQFFSGV